MQQLKALGAVGVGQSSWGPTLFAIAPDEPTTRAWAARLLATWRLPPLDIRLSAVCNTGAVVRRIQAANFGASARA